MVVQLNEDERIDQLMQYGLRIIQSKSVFSFSLDAVLLGNFAQVPQGSKAKIVDLCAGNGAVTLMVSQKTKSSVYGLELQSRLIDMAERSIELNDLSERVQMIQANIKDSYEYIRKDSVDVITCNPPYFKVNQMSKKNPNHHLALARHEVETNLKEVLEYSSGLLKTNGKAYFVHRPDRFLEILDAMRAVKLAPKRVRFVYPKKDREANMVLIEGIKQGSESGFKMLPPLVVFDEQDNYLDEVRTMIYGK